MYSQLSSEPLRWSRRRVFCIAVFWIDSRAPRGNAGSRYPGVYARRYKHVPRYPPPATGATSIRSFSPLNEYYIPLRRAPEWDPQHCFKMSCKIVKVTVERYSSPLGIQHKAPRISWRFEGDAKGWKQASYDIKLVRAGKTEGYHVDKADSVFVPWPSEPLSSRRVTFFGPHPYR